MGQRSGRSLAGQLWKGGKDPRQSLVGFCPFLYTHLLHPDPRRVPQPSVSVPRASATSPKTWCLVTSSIPCRVPLYCPAPPALVDQQVGVSVQLIARVADVSLGASPLSAGYLGRPPLPPAGASSGCHSRPESPGGGLGRWSVVLALALQFQPFLELG